MARCPHGSTNFTSEPINWHDDSHREAIVMQLESLSGRPPLIRDFPTCCLWAIQRQSVTAYPTYSLSLTAKTTDSGGSVEKDTCNGMPNHF